MDKGRIRSLWYLRYYIIGNFFYRNYLKRVAYFFQYLGLKRTGNDIASSASISRDVYFPHPIGIVIGSGVVIGKKVTIFQNVTIGGKEGKYPRIKDGVIIYGGSYLFGNIRIGKKVVIGPNSVIFKSLDCGTYSSVKEINRIK